MTLPRISNCPPQHNLKMESTRKRTPTKTTDHRILATVANEAFEDANETFEDTNEVFEDAVEAFEDFKKEEILPEPE